MCSAAPSVMAVGGRQRHHPLSLPPPVPPPPITRALILKNCPFYSKGKVQSTRSSFLQRPCPPRPRSTLYLAVGRGGEGAQHYLHRQTTSEPEPPLPSVPCPRVSRCAAGKGCWLSRWAAEGGGRTDGIKEGEPAAYIRGRIALRCRPPAHPPRGLRRTVM